MRPRWFHSSRWLMGVAAGMIALAICARKAPAQTSPYTPYQHRAWYIYLIAQYTEWPKEAFHGDSAPFVLGILGEDPFGKDIDVIKDKPIKNRKLLIKYFKTAQEIEDCHALFISASEQDRLPETLKALENSCTLTVAEMDGFIQHNGIVKFWVERKSRTEGFLRFEINEAAAEKAKLRINSQVLNLAKPEKIPN